MPNIKVVVFKCGNEEYALPVEKVVSIEKFEKVNRIPHLPDYVLGLTRIRDELLPVLDFEQILYGNRANSSEAKIIVLQADEFVFGLLVLEAKEILDIEEDQLKQVGLVNYTKTQYFSAVANLTDRMITLVSPDVLVNTLDGIKELKEYMKSLTEEEKQSIM
ncbi:chemotaxis protein CheW [Rummeliibacillus sp. SL167]|uniref:chemotaxis protein CheW n=1 Tax=Rummeliibacillus sp. SL167 TaxID=2579792 RepID=UPI0011B6E50F|nr:chemotaxis protein CheW [Rummeliibacillus sp. SL167]